MGGGVERLQMEKAAGRGVLEGERRVGEAEGQWLSWLLLAQGRAVRVSHCRAEVGRVTSWPPKRRSIFPTLRQPHPQGPMALPSPSPPLNPGDPGFCSQTLSPSHGRHSAPDPSLGGFRGSAHTPS